MAISIIIYYFVVILYFWNGNTIGRLLFGTKLQKSNGNHSMVLLIIKDYNQTIWDMLTHIKVIELDGNI